MDTGHVDQGMGSRGLGDLGEVASLGAEVQLSHEGVAELLGQRLGVERPSPLRPPGHHAGEPPRDRQVPLHHFHEPGPAHLHHHGAAVAPPRRMGLGDGRRTQRVPIELGEDLRQRPPQLGRDGRLHLLPFERRRRRVQAGQFFLDGRRHQVRTGGEELAELDEDAAGLLQCQPGAPGQLFGGVGRAASPAQPDQRRQAVTGGDPRYLHGPPGDPSSSAHEAEQREPRPLPLLWGAAEQELEDHHRPHRPDDREGDGHEVEGGRIGPGDVAQLVEDQEGCRQPADAEAGEGGEEQPPPRELAGVEQGPSHPCEEEEDEEAREDPHDPGEELAHLGQANTPRVVASIRRRRSDAAASAARRRARGRGW